MKLSKLSTIEAFKNLELEWEQLNDISPKGNIFTSWLWLFTWWEIYQSDGNRELFILTCRDEENNLLGIAPFQLINNIKKYFPCGRQVIMLGTGETDGSMVFGEYMDLLISPGHEEPVIGFFSDYLYKEKHLWDGVKFHQLLDNSYISKLFSDYDESISYTKKAEGFRTIIQLPDTYKAYLMTLKKKMRNNITRTFSRLEREQEYRIETIDNVDEVEGAIALLAKLNRSRRGDMQLSSSFDQINFENYHRKLSKRILLQGNEKHDISLRILRFKETPVAMLYSFIDGDTIHAYQSGFEKENGQRYSLLTTMLTQEISNSIKNKKLKYFNFMYSEEEATYKRRYSGVTETMYNISYDNKNLKCRFYLFLHGPVKEQVKKYIIRK